MEASGHFHTLVSLTREGATGTQCSCWVVSIAVLHDLLKKKVSCPYQESSVLMDRMVGLFGLYKCLGRIDQRIKQSNCKAGSRFAIHNISHHCWSPNIYCLEEYCFCDLTATSLVAISRLRGVFAQKSVSLHNHQHENLIL
jgi:hypothetical protein